MSNYITETWLAYQKVLENQQLLENGFLPADRVSLNEGKKVSKRKGNIKQSIKQDEEDGWGPIFANEETHLNEEELYYAIDWMLAEDFATTEAEAINMITTLEAEGYDIIESFMEADEESLSKNFTSASRLTRFGNGRMEVPITSEETLSILENAANRVFNYDNRNLNEVVTKQTREGEKYRVRVVDRNSKSSYVRFATREKIAQLRSNPAIASVELTDHEPSEKDSRGVTNVRQDFSAGPNSNRSSYKSKINNMNAQKPKPPVSSAFPRKFQ